jgi:hypothetical protein
MAAVLYFAKELPRRETSRKNGELCDTHSSSCFSEISPDRDSNSIRVAVGAIGRQVCGIHSSCPAAYPSRR